ncbi:diguanylate cyclase [Agrobacterium tumefaciens]|uniref:diguanylate cyclase n=1 Tax=Agrobacterium tumefaciens TaxID=358 RepID=UPI000E0B4C00
MTGIFNKVTFSERVPKMIATSRRGDRIVLLLILDLDGFKAVNDHRGHSAGDLILQEFSLQVSSELGKSDCIGRRR